MNTNEVYDEVLPPGGRVSLSNAPAPFGMDGMPNITKDRVAAQGLEPTASSDGGADSD